LLFASLEEHGEGGDGDEAECGFHGQNVWGEMGRSRVFMHLQATVTTRLQLGMFQEPSGGSGAAE
jgi:hypothetical protein